jgi:hypothetical protein
MKRLLSLSVVLLVACTSNVPRLVPPDTVEAFCSEKVPRGTAIASILSSVADSIQPIDVPDDAVLRKHVKDDGGVIGHWKSQPLYMPGTARVLGVRGDYIDVTEVVVTNDLAGKESRIVYVTINTPQGKKRLALRAYDTQNACIEGRRLS